MEGELSPNSMLMVPNPILKRPNEPWLVFQHGVKLKYQTFYSISQDKHYLKSIPLMRGKPILECSHGWMVLGDTASVKECFLFNPNSMKKIQLPCRDFVYSKCILTSSPDDPACLVLFVSNPRDGTLIFRLCSPRQNSRNCWIKKEMKFKESASLIEVAAADGKIYAVIKFDGIKPEVLIIEAANNLFRVTKMGIEMEKFPLPDSPLMHREMMVESCGDLFVVRQIFEDDFNPLEVIDIEIFKLNFDTKKWERVKGIGSRTFFSGPYCQTFISANSGDGDSDGIIYFTMDDDKSLHRFSVKDKSIKISMPCPNVKNNWLKPNWFLPSG